MNDKWETSDVLVGGTSIELHIQGLINSTGYRVNFDGYASAKFEGRKYKSFYVKKIKDKQTFETLYECK